MLDLALHLLQAFAEGLDLALESAQELAQGI
jgi:hypothetical protein